MSPWLYLKGSWFDWDEFAWTSSMFGIGTEDVGWVDAICEKEFAMIELIGVQWYEADGVSRACPAYSPEEVSVEKSVGEILGVGKMLPGFSGLQQGTSFVLRTHRHCCRISSYKRTERHLAAHYLSADAQRGTR